MTAFDYAAKRDTADTLITKFGQAVSLRHISNSGTPDEPTQTTTDYATKAAIVDYSVRLVDGENILRTDRRGIVAAGPLTRLGVTTIAVPDALVVAGVAVPIVQAKPINPAGVIVAWDCQLRF